MRVKHYHNIASKMEERYKDVPRVYCDDCFCDDCIEAFKAVKADKHIRVFKKVGKPIEKGLPFSKED